MTSTDARGPSLRTTAITPREYKESTPAADPEERLVTPSIDRQSLVTVGTARGRAEATALPWSPTGAQAVPRDRDRGDARHADRGLRGEAGSVRCTGTERRDSVAGPEACHRSPVPVAAPGTSRVRMYRPTQWGSSRLRQQPAMGQTALGARSAAATRTATAAPCPRGGFVQRRPDCAAGRQNPAGSRAGGRIDRVVPPQDRRRILHRCVPAGRSRPAASSG